MEIITNKEKQKILNTIPFWYLGKQKYPKYISTSVGILDLENFRRHELGQIREGEKKLIDFFNSVVGDVIPQYPIIITDLYYWDQCLRNVGLNNSKYKNRRLFILDGFSPSRNSAIEADYITTHDPQYDIARDYYIQHKHNIITHRVLGYGFNKKDDEKTNRNIIKKFANNIWDTEYINYNSFAVDQWLHRCPGLYDLLVSISLGNEPKGSEQLLTYYKDFCKIVGRPLNLINDNQI